MNKNNAWAWSLMLITTLLFGVGLGLSLGYAFFAPREEAPAQIAATPGEAEPAPEIESPPRPATASPTRAVITTPAKPAARPATPAKSESDYWAARHLFVTVNGQWLADAAEDMLAELRPGAVLLTESNLGSRAQTFSLVREIKQAVGIGDGLGDLPLIAAQQEGGPYNQLAVDNAPSAQVVGQSGDADLARRLGQEYAEAAVGRGIAVAFAPVLDVFEVGAINPGYVARTFGTDQSLVTAMGLAMADGLRQGGVLPVVKHFPGYGAATYGPDGLLVVLNKDYGGLARVMYPFNEAVRYGVPGMLVAHVAVPALDPDHPRRSAALSPVLINDLVRGRWGFEGVIIADDVAQNSMTRAIGAEAAAVQALAAGCDAVLVLDPDPNRIRSVAAAIRAAVNDGTLSREQLDQSVERLERWQDAIGNLNPLTPEAEPAVAEVAVAQPAVEPPAQSKEDVPPPAEPEQVAEAMPEPAAPAPEPAQAETTPVDPAPLASGEVKPEPEPAKEVVAKAEESETKPAETVPTPDPEPATSEADANESESSSESAPAAVEVDEPAPEPEAAKSQPEPEPAETKLAKVDAPPVALPLPEKGETSSREGESGGNAASTLPEAEERAPVTPDEAVRSSIVHTMKDGEMLSSVAEAYGVSVIDLVRWNELESAQVDAGTELTVYLPDGVEPRPALEATAESTPAPEPEEPAEAELVAVPAGKLVHTVAEGDTLSGVAAKYSVSMTNITLWNGLTDAALKPGQLLTIFLDPAAEEAAKAEPPPSQPAPATPDPAATAAKTDGGPKSITVKSTAAEHEVESGDTLLKISREYKVSVDALMKANDLENANQIRIGQKLKIPAP